MEKLRATSSTTVPPLTTADALQGAEMTAPMSLDMQRFDEAIEIGGDDVGDEEEQEYEEVEGDSGGGVEEVTVGQKLADGFYNVEAIRRKRICKGEPQYLIKWRCWPESANTWEPVDHLQTCLDVVEEYEESLKSGQRKGFRKRKRMFTSQNQKGQYSDGVSKSKTSPAKLFGDNASIRNLDADLQQAMLADGDGAANQLSNSTLSAAGQSNLEQKKGANRRKSGSVRRFLQDITSSNIDSFGTPLPLNVSCDSASGASVITKIIKAIRFSGNNQYVSVMFEAVRFDGKKVLVDNEFLKSTNPLLLINFYEQHFKLILRQRMRQFVRNEYCNLLQARTGNT